MEKLNSHIYMYNNNNIKKGRKKNYFHIAMTTLNEIKLKY